MERVSRALLAARYEGTPASTADVLAMCQSITQYSGNEWSVELDDGVVLVLKETSPDPAQTPGHWRVSVGQWVIVAPDTGIVARVSDAVYDVRYKTLDSIATDAVAQAAIVASIANSAPVQNAITAQINAMAMYGGFGLAPLPTLTPGATSSPIAVTIDPAQPNTGYVARAFAISGAAVLTTLAIVSITKMSGTLAQVVIKNNGAASIGGILMLHVTAPIGGASQVK